MNTWNFFLGFWGFIKHETDVWLKSSHTRLPPENHMLFACINTSPRNAVACQNRCVRICASQIMICINKISRRATWRWRCERRRDDTSLWQRSVCVSAKTNARPRIVWPQIYKSFFSESSMNNVWIIQESCNKRMVQWCAMANRAVILFKVVLYAVHLHYDIDIPRRK